MGLLRKAWRAPCPSGVQLYVDFSQRATALSYWAQGHSPQQDGGAARVLTVCQTTQVNTGRREEEEERRGGARYQRSSLHKLGRHPTGQAAPGAAPTLRAERPAERAWRHKTNAPRLHLRSPRTGGEILA